MHTAKGDDSGQEKLPDKRSRRFIFAIFSLIFYGIIQTLVTNDSVKQKQLRMDESKMKDAVNAVRQGKLTVRRAAVQFGVAKSTLSDRLNQRWPTTRKGFALELTEEEETAVVNYIKHMSRHGFPMTRAMTRCFIIEIVKTSGRRTRFNTDTGPSDQWFRHFFVRNPELRERIPQDQDRGRAVMSNFKVMDQYFNMLDEVLHENNLHDKPSQVYNCDETGWTGKEASKTKVIGDKLSTFTRRRVSTTDHVTAHLCVCADGHFLPSMVIFKGSFPHRNYKDGVPDNWAFATSECGYMDTTLFQTWFEKIFLPNCGSQRPVILIMDNHDSHISLPLMEKAIANNVILMGLPAHTTHLLQPLDVKLIGPLKARFATIANSLGFTSANTTVGKAKFPILLKYAVDQATPKSIQDAFAESGMYPCNRQAISNSKLTPPSFCSESGEGSNNVDIDIRTCETCGSYLKNPLVTQGLIPERLANILVPPPVKAQSETKKKRVVSEARVLTGGEMIQILREKEETVRKQAEAKVWRAELKEKRLEEKQKEQEERALKRQKKEEDRQRKKDIKIRKALGGKLAERMFTCGVCGERGRVNDELNGIVWYGCDERMCLKWFHEECLSMREREFLMESESEGEPWYCKVCKPWLYEEE